MGVIGGTQHGRLVVSLLALALAIAAGSLPATAQSGPEAVVCVGSETRTLATNPIRRVFTEDMEVVYRTGVDIGQRDQVERDLSSELGSYPEVWCAWSDLGDDHAVIISYTGVIRQDLTVDPEDPRFQAFSVGFGEDFNEAQTQATTISERFSSQNDGSGFEVLLRETRSVAEGVVTADGERGLFSPPDGSICTGDYSPDSCWIELADRPGCFLWNPAPIDNETVGWSGECSDGFAQGNGRVNWYENGELGQIEETRMQDGMRNGPHVLRSADGTRESEGSYMDGQRQGTWTHFYGDGTRGVGPYVNGELHGTWTYYDQDGNRMGTQRFENGRRVGGLDGPVALDHPPTVAPWAKGGQLLTRHVRRPQHRWAR